MTFSYRAKQLANLPVEKLAARLSEVVDDFSAQEKIRLLKKLTADKTGCDLNNQLAGAITLAEHTLPKLRAEELWVKVESDLTKNRAPVRASRIRFEKWLGKEAPSDSEKVWFGTEPIDTRHMSHFSSIELSRYVPRFIGESVRTALVKSYDRNLKEGGFPFALRELVAGRWGYQHPATQKEERAKFESDRLEKGRANIRKASALLMYLHESEEG